MSEVEVPSIEAAGGVVLRTTPSDGTRRSTADAPTGHDGVEVLVVHRPAYDDWSLPKGKLDPGEEAMAAAVREVEEETGVTAQPGPELPSMTYRVKGRLKRVRWFRMEYLDGDPAARPPDREVDIARWMPVADAVTLLTYGPDRQLLADTLERTST
jgi:8-oxo-dGTP pyrophosphatase MutT (NUDIX family)